MIHQERERAWENTVLSFKGFRPQAMLFRRIDPYSLNLSPSSTWHARSLYKFVSSPHTTPQCHSTPRTSLEIVPKDNFLLLGGLLQVKIRWRGKALATSMLRWDTSEVAWPQFFVHSSNSCTGQHGSEHCSESGEIHGIMARIYNIIQSHLYIHLWHLCFMVSFVYPLFRSVQRHWKTTACSHVNDDCTTEFLARVMQNLAQMNLFRFKLVQFIVGKAALSSSVLPWLERTFDRPAAAERLRTVAERTSEGRNDVWNSTMMMMMMKMMMTMMMMMMMMMMMYLVWCSLLLGVSKMKINCREYHATQQSFQHSRKRCLDV